MWSPTHVQVTVQRGKDLLTKGKNGTNDAFVTIGLGKEKYQTSIKEKSLKDVEWHEECELQIPVQGNTAEIVLTALHRNFMGVDEFLGTIHIPLSDFDVYERPKNRWYGLKSKNGKEKNKPRGELEVKVGFTVKAGSLTDLTKKEKHKSSLGQLNVIAHNVGGSLLSIGSLEKRKGLKKFAKSIGNKIARKPHSKDTKDLSGSMVGSGSLQGSPIRNTRQQRGGDADPGVVSDQESDDDFTFDDLSHKSSCSSLNTHQTAVEPAKGSMENIAESEFLKHSSPVAPAKPPRALPNPDTVDEWEQKLYGKQSKDSQMDTLKRRSWESPKTFLTSQPEEDEPPSVEKNLHSSTPTVANGFPPEVQEPEEKEMSKLARKFKHFRKGKDVKMTEVVLNNTENNIIIGGESKEKMSVRLSPEMIKKYESKSREDLIVLLEHQTKKMKETEDYLDDLLLRVMETTPRILQNPYVGCKLQAKNV